MIFLLGSFLSWDACPGVFSSGYSGNLVILCGVGILLSIAKMFSGFLTKIDFIRKLLVVCWGEVLYYLVIEGMAVKIMEVFLNIFEKFDGI